MFTLEIYDRCGNELHEGDVVRISDGKHWNFYSEVKYLEEEQTLAPFHTFCFHSVEKVDKIPNDAVLCKEERYKVWYVKEPETDQPPESANKYLTDWRECERHLKDRLFRITMIPRPMPEDY